MRGRAGGHWADKNGIPDADVNIGYAIFANHTSCGTSDALELNGSDLTINGGVHSNSVLKVPGSNNDFNGDSSYVCSINNSGSGNSYQSGSPYSTSTKPSPVNYVYSDFDPGIPCTRRWTSDVDLKSVNNIWVGDNPSSKQLKPGVYCSTRKLTLSESGVSGSVTLVAQQEVNISGSNFNLTPYWNSVLLFTYNTSSSALDVSGSGGQWEGLILAPRGKAKIAGSGNWSFSGAVIADQVQVSGSSFSMTALGYGSTDNAVHLVE